MSPKSEKVLNKVISVEIPLNAEEKRIFLETLAAAAVEFAESRLEKHGEKS